MPIHYGSKDLNYHTISSPLGTQLPQAVRWFLIIIRGMTGEWLSYFLNYSIM
jgi:hypothetical protein